MSEEKLLDSLLYAGKYPFLPNVKEFIKRRNFSINDLVVSKYLERAKERIKNAVLFSFIDSKLNDSEREVFSYLIELYLIAAINDPYLSKKISFCEGKRIEKLLLNEHCKLIEYIGKNIFGLDIIFEEENDYDFKMNVFEYIQFSSKMNKPEWKLVNKQLYGGKVSLTKKEIVKILRIKIEEYILQKINEHKAISCPPFLKEVINEIKSFIKKPIISKMLSLDIEAFPPCIKNIYEKISLNESVSHFTKFTLVSFLINLGFDIEKIIEIFSNLGDFNEKITKYQVEHIAGIRGGKTKYKMPSCKTLKTHGICVEQCNVNSPLNFYLKEKKDE